MIDYKPFPSSSMSSQAKEKRGGTAIMQKEPFHHETSPLIAQFKVTKKQPYRKTDSVKLFELLSFTAKRKKSPTIPIDYLSPVIYRDDTAGGLTKCIISYIQLKEGQAERMSTTGRIDKQTSFTNITGWTRTIGRKEWISGTSTNGSMYLSSTIKGCSVKIEEKMKDSQSRDHANYQKSIEQAGGVYIIARSFESFLTWFNQTFKQ